MDCFITILFTILIIVLIISYYGHIFLKKRNLESFINNKTNNSTSKKDLQESIRKKRLEDAKVPYTTKNKYTFDNNYLYPVKGLGGQCQKLGLRPAYMPQICSINGVVNNFANCMCQDKNGVCMKCYPELKKYNKQSFTIYNDILGNDKQINSVNMKPGNTTKPLSINTNTDIPGVTPNSGYKLLPQAVQINNPKCKKYYDDFTKCNSGKISS
jgi:hypothetical protein